MALLSVLKKHKNPIALPELLLTLGADFAERSVRRWLSEMITEGLIKNMGPERVIELGITKQQFEKWVHQRLIH